MDEIIIDEKKYISSKRAAKVTGYAKDYVGQLCREGRVQARLVGRAWYVLESAIHDHRFGNSQDVVQTHEAATEDTVRDSDRWESPRYVPVEDVILPLYKEETVMVSPVAPKVEAPQHNEERWATWLDMVSVAPSSISDVSEDYDADNKNQQIYKTVDIRRNIEQGIQEPKVIERRDVIQKSGKKKGSGSIVRAIRLLGLLTALMFASIAVLNSGILDEYLTSSSRVNLFTGLSIYVRAY